MPAWTRGFALLLLLGMVAATDLPAADSVGRPIDDFTLRDFRGHEFTLHETAGDSLTVVAFLGTECPLAKLYAPRLQQIADDYADRGVVVIGVNSNVQDSVTELGAFARRHDISFPMLKDPGNRVADQFSATRTPEVFLLDENLVVRYQGRIDDQYVVGLVRDHASRHDLRAAIDDLLTGEAVSVSSTEALGCIIGRVRDVNEDSPVTWSNQIARIFNRRCVECHREGEIAPFTLTTYDDVVGWGEMISEVVRQRRMPPWHADPAHGEFANDRSLSEQEQQLIFDWVANGCPEGDPADLPKPPTFTTGWQLAREPDVVFPMRDKPFQVPADAGREGVRYQYFEVDPGFTQDMWMEEGEALPGNHQVVHHIIVYGKPEGARNRRDWIFLTAYVPGLRLTAYPPGAAKRIPAGAKLVFEVHYTPVGSPQEDVSRVGFVFADPDNVTHEVVTTEVGNGGFHIPPNDPDYEVTASSAPAPREVTLLSMSPHMHLRGKSFKYELVGLDGSGETILDVPAYDFNWQTRYVLAEPRTVPFGTRMVCTAVYDNSEDNLANPDPSVEVTWGDQSWDEMMLGYFDLLLPRNDERQAGERPFRAGINAEALFAQFDDDEDGSLSKEEVEANPILKQFFDRVDADSDGLIQREELDAAIRRLRQQLQQ